MRFDDIVRSERYFTATLLPALLFHDNLKGVQHFVDLLESKSTTERSKEGTPSQKGTTAYDFQNVEVITEFHINRDLKVGLDTKARPIDNDDDHDDERHDAPDVVIVAGQ